MITMIRIPPMDVTVEGIVTEPNFEDEKSILNISFPITVRPEVSVNSEREEQYMNTEAPKIYYYYNNYYY